MAIFLSDSNNNETFSQEERSVGDELVFVERSPIDIIIWYWKCFSSLWVEKSQGLFCFGAVDEMDV